MVVGFAIETVVWLYEGYLWTLTIADKRVEGWMLMSSPKYTLMWTVAYFLLVLIGPQIMQRFKPLCLRPVLVVYNAASCLLNVYIFFELIVNTWRAGYSYYCQPVNYTDDPLELRIAEALWWFYLSKLIEFSDTLFFILRGKTNQLTFLHVYHHSTMFCLWWIGIKWVAGGSSFLVAMMNSFVHSFMYLYYGLAAAFPNKQFRWKKYLTTLQMVQFFYAIVATSYGLYIDCRFPHWMCYTLIAYMLSFIVLFGNFWAHAYARPQTTIKDAKKRRKDSGTVGAEINGFLPGKEGAAKAARRRRSRNRN